VSPSISIKDRYQKHIESFGNKLRSIREECGLTQEELAYSAGISFTTLNRIEQGHVNPSLATIYAIAEALGISPKDLV
jgi:transcriptional regulator with XRE-family HTH domain